MVADCLLAVLVERPGHPNRAAVGQRTETGIEMVKPVLHQLDRNDQAAKHLAQSSMRMDVRSKSITAKQHPSAEKGIPFPFEKHSSRQADDLVTLMGEPGFELGLLALSFYVTKVTPNEFAADDQAGVCGEHHVRQILF